MSGIVAIYNPDGRPAEPGLLDRILDAAAYRGPDGLRKWTDGPVALGYAASHTTPVSLGEAQPLGDESGRFVITFDGRIDNREELAAAIRARGVAPRSRADAELCLLVFQCWGEDAFGMILGDFALALWDSREQRLICARDPAGAKPLYYMSGRAFVAASELQQVLMHPDASEEPNEAMAAEYMCGTLVQRDETMFRRILRLPQGEILVVTPRGVSRRRYYDLRPGREIRYRSDREYAEHFLEIFREAVRCRMEAAGAGVAAHLSGGLDSSFIVGVAQSLMRDGSSSPGRFETFSLHASDPGADEQFYFQQVIDMWGLKAHVVEPCVLDRQSCAEMLHHYRDFANYPNGATFRYIDAEASRQGFKVMLSGHGGDGWLEGSEDYYADLLGGLRIRELLRRLRTDLGATAEHPGAYATLRTFMRRAVFPLLPFSLQKAARRVARRGIPPSLIDPAFARRVNLRERLETGLRRRRPGMTLGQQAVYDTFFDPWSAHVFEMADRDSACSGIERRHPFFDRRVIDFLIAIPEEQRCEGPRTKVILRNAGKGLMPQAVIDRMTKAEFSRFAARMVRAMMEGGILDDMALSRLGWIVVPRLRELCERFVVGSDNLNPWVIWNALMTELWVCEVLRAERIVAPKQRAAKGLALINLAS